MLREFLINFFRDDTFGPRMGLFNLTHIVFYLLVIGLTIFMALKFYKKDEKTKSKILDVLAIVVVCLYFGDFFVHPLMNNENSLIVDKLPFHLCTSACILIAITRNWRKKFYRFYPTMVILGLIGAFLYITCPTGVSGDYLFCYRTLQTLVYHSLLFMFGVLSIAYSDIEVSLKNLKYTALVVIIEIVISLFANAIYTTPDHHYDWYFTTGSSFGINEYLMPIIMFVVLILMYLIVYYVTLLIKEIRNK